MRQGCSDGRRSGSGYHEKGQAGQRKGVCAAAPGGGRHIDGYDGNDCGTGDRRSKKQNKRGPRVMFYRCLKAVVKPLFFCFSG